MTTITTDRLTITLRQPPRVLHPNGRTRKHRYRWSEARKMRNLACAMATVAIRECFGGVPPRWERAVVAVTVYYGLGQKRMDADNIIGWCKAIFDGLQDAEVYGNDRNISFDDPRHERDRTRPRVMIEVRERE